MYGNELKAIIWDMDGVLVDTSDFHFNAWREVYRRHAEDSRPLPRSRFNSLFGMMNQEMVLQLFGARLASAEFIEIVSREKETLFRSNICQQIKPLPGVETWLATFQKLGILQALASSAPGQNVTAVMEEVALEPFFSVILSGDSSASLASKPAPDIYLEAARRLQVRPRQCLVIEDSIVGVMGAKTAGMACLAVTTTHPAADLAAADWQIDDFRRLIPSIMLERFASREMPHASNN